MWTGGIFDKFTLLGDSQVFADRRGLVAGDEWVWGIQRFVVLLEGLKYMIIPALS